MMSTRAYRNAFPQEIVLNELKEFSGTQFDPNIVESFFRILKYTENETEFFVPLLDKKHEGQTLQKAA